MPAITRGSDALLVQNPVRPARQITCPHPRSAPRVRCHCYQTVGLVFQSFYLQPFLTLRRNLEVAAMPRHMPQSERTAQVTQLAEQVGLAQRLHHRPRELSGGRIQRAAIARAQACIGQPFCWK